MENIIYDIRWSSQLNEKFIMDFCHVCSTVFKKEYKRNEFDRKFIQNIYGPSVLVVVYINDTPSAARALWRNDINGKEAYQPGDTCVMEKCRGKGVFSIMTKKSINLLPKSSIIYNFPNNNSYPGYIKMGWKLIHDYKMRLLCSYQGYHKEHPVRMDNNYAQWWLIGRKLFYTKYFGHYLLLQKDHRTMCYRVLAEVNMEIAIQFQHIRFGLLFYKSSKSTWYSKFFSASHVVSRSIDVDYIPSWKIDAV